MHIASLILCFVFILAKGVAIETDSSKKSSKIEQAEKDPLKYIDDETDIFYWNDYEESPIDNPTTPFIKENKDYQKESLKKDKEQDKQKKSSHLDSK